MYCNVSWRRFPSVRRLLSSPVCESLIRLSSKHHSNILTARISPLLRLMSQLRLQYRFMKLLYKCHRHSTPLMCDSGALYSSLMFNLVVWTPASSSLQQRAAEWMCTVIMTRWSRLAMFVVIHRLDFWDMLGGTQTAGRSGVTGFISPKNRESSKSKL